MRNLISLIFFGFSMSTLLAQGIRGKIINLQGDAIAFANVYVPELSSGTTSNIEGNYELKLPEGKWKVLFQYLGYQTETRDLTITKSFQEIDVQLIFQDYQIPEIKVLASGEDPAYYIMRRAIAMAPYYQKQVSKYNCKVYLKGSGVVEKIPFLFKKQLKKEGLKENEPFVMETVSKIDFELPDQLKQQVLAMRSSGKDNNTSPMGMITNNLYEAEKYGVVSPVGKNALKVYRFKLDGVFEDQGHVINKIKVIPKTNSNDVFTGSIFIADGFWNIHSADLRLHIPMTDVRVHQLYAEVNKYTWMPVSLDFDMDFSGLGFKMKYKYVASINEYKTTLNPALNHSFLDRINIQQAVDQQIVNYQSIENAVTKPNPKPETITKTQKKIEAMMDKKELNNRETVKLNRMINEETKRNSPPEPLEIKSTFKVSQKQVNNDTAYWSGLRPIPLTESEKNSFSGKDSFLVVSSKPEYQDSVRDSKRKFKIKHILFGKTYDYSIDSIKKHQHFSIPTLTDPTSLSFNSVDGLRLELPFCYSFSDSTGNSMRISPHFAYAFARRKLDATLNLQQRINGLTNSWISFSGGTTTSDFNRNTPLSAITNDLYTLWLKENYKRFYRRDFIELSFSRDIVNGLNFRFSTELSNNSPLSNHSTFSFIDYKDKEIQPNIPINNTLEDWQLEKHQSFVSSLSLEYTPRHRYRIINNTKIYADSKFPTYSLRYNGGFSGVFGSDSRYDLLRIGMKQRISFAIDDDFSYELSAGSFLNSSRIYFDDFQHFNTQPTGFMFSGYTGSFRLLPFYTYSTAKSFFEVHGNWQTRRLILKQLPVFRNSSMLKENVFVNFLSTPELRNYMETGYGINNLFLLLNVEAVAGFENGKFRNAGIKVSLNLK